MAFNAIRQPERTEEIDAKAQSVTDTFLLQPATIAARLEFEQRVLGYSRIDGDTLTRVHALRHPERPWLRAQKVSYRVPDGLMQEALPSLIQASPGEYDLLTMRNWNTDAKTGLLASVTYGLPEWGATEAGDPTEEELWTVDIDSFVKNITLPNDRFVWRKTAYTTPLNSTPIGQDDVASFVTLTYENITLTKNFVPRFARTAISKLKNRVNAVDFILDGVTYKPETLRYVGAKATRAVSTLGTKGFKLSQSWEHNTTFDTMLRVTAGTPPTEVPVGDYVGWNRLYNPILKHWDYAVAASSIASGSGSNLDAYRYIYFKDSDVFQPLGGVDVYGFKLLLDPRAA